MVGICYFTLTELPVFIASDRECVGIDELEGTWKVQFWHILAYRLSVYIHVS